MRATLTNCLIQSGFRDWPNRPYRSANVGSTSRLRAVEVKSPPRIMIAIGPSTSRPGAPLPIASGSRPSAVTSAVIRIGRSRSEAPRMAASKPQLIPSTETKWSKCEIIMIELRMVMPNSVTNPTIEPKRELSAGKQRGKHAANQCERNVHQDQQQVSDIAERDVKQAHDDYR